MSKFFWCILIIAVLLLVSCDSSGDTLSETESSAALSDSSSVAQNTSSIDSAVSDSDALSSEGTNDNISEDESSLCDEESEDSVHVSEDTSAESSQIIEGSVTDSSAESVESEEPDESEVSDEPEESSNFSSELPVESSDEESSEESSEQPNVQPNSPLSSVNRQDTAVNLAKGKSYTVSANSNEKYPDNGKKLTDGEYKASFDHDNWVGFSHPSTIVVVLDLGKTEKNIADFAIGTLRQLDYGIGSPENVTYEISTDGKTYQKIGTVYRSADVSRTTAYAYNLNLSEPISARYVRYTIKGTDSSWLFLGELYAIRYVPEEAKPSYYGNSKLPQVSTPVYWPDNSADRNKTINLIAGKKPLVESKDEITSNFATEYYNSITALPKLTDGSFAKVATYSDSALVHFTRASERYLYFDLGYTSAVSGVLYSFLNEESTGVYLPSIFSVYLSDNGLDWQRVYTTQETANKSSELCKKSVTFDKVYKARFVKITFSVSSHVFCDELQIFGTKAIPSSAVSIVPELDNEPEKLGYKTPDDFLGVHNVLLSYHCLPDNGTHSESGLITVEEYLPHVGYYDQTGKLADTFFDAFLYLPYTSFNFSDYACSLDGWKFYLDDIYASGRNMDALNQAVEQVKNELNKPDYTCTVFTSILYPWEKLYVSKTPNSFGDVDGDGVIDAFSSLENRKKAVKWMMDQEYDRFMAKNYENLTFGGFYWFEEAISVGNNDDKELINFAADYAHSLGVKIFWIPYYCASGYDRWQEYGFDLACMQPNYMFGNSDDPSVLQSTAEKTSELGMCVEIEMNSLSRDEILRYMQYLAAGEEFGYMHAVKMYYQSGVPGVVYAAYQSKDPFEHSVYDLTYLFAKEKFTAAVSDYTTSKLSYDCNGDTLIGNAIAKAEGTYQFSLGVSPSHGDLRLNEDGSFIYYADQDYTGIDRFSVYLDFGYGKSDEIIVTITVK